MKHVVDTIEGLLTAAMQTAGERTRMFVISTYVIGKERILLAVRAKCRVKIRRKGELQRRIIEAKVLIF